MKLLLVSALPPPEGGLAAWTEGFLEYCGDKGVSAELVDISLNGRRRERINARTSLREELCRTARILRELKSKLRAFGPDIVHINTPCGPMGIFRDAAIASRARRSGAKVAVHFHCGVENMVVGGARTSALKRIAKNSDALITLNSSSEEFVFAVTGKRPVTVPNFIKPEYVSEKRVVNDRLREVLFVGHVQRSKGCAELIEAARRLPGIRFTLIGPVSDEAAAWDKPDNVTFAGELEHSAIPERMRGADLFVFPSYSEGFSISLTEAMAAGLPCAATDVGANRDMIEDCGGVIFEKGSADALVSAIESLSDRQVRQSVSDRCIEKVRRSYLLSTAAERVFNVYADVLNNSGN